MISAKIERLKRDSRRLKSYVHIATKNGKTNIATKIRKHKNFLDEHIAEMKKVGQEEKQLCTSPLNLCIINYRY